jgi:hypothetical protein
MKVYVLFAGNKYEGLRPVGLYKTEEKAKEVKQSIDEGDAWEGDKIHDQYNSTIELWEVEK